MGVEDAISIPESMPVQLTRMEGVLNLLAYQMAAEKTRVDKHETEIGLLKSITQRLDEQAVARDATAIALASALKEAEANRRVQSEAKWSPVAKLFAVIAVVGIVWGIVAPFLAP